MTVGCRLLIDRSSEVKHLYDTVGSQIKLFSDYLYDLSSGSFPVPKVSAMIDVGVATPIA